MFLVALALRLVVAGFVYPEHSDPRRDHFPFGYDIGREVSAARQTGAGKPSTAAAQNDQNEPHYHPKEGRAICG